MISKSKKKRLWLFLACLSIVNIAHLLTMHLFPASEEENADQSFILAWMGEQRHLLISFRKFC